MTINFKCQEMSPDPNYLTPIIRRHEAMAAVHSRPEEAAPTRQPAPPGLPDSAAGGARSRLALASVGSGSRAGVFTAGKGRALLLFS
jgi:hypothetical protein